MAYLTAGSRALNPLHSFEYPDTSKLWWRQEAWNEDTITWLATSVDADEMVDRLDVIEQHLLGSFSSLLLPEMAMPGNRLASFYLTLGDVPNLDTPSGITEYVPTGFSFDPTNSLSLPIQLVGYYLATEPFQVPQDSRGRSAFLVRERIQALLKSTQLTVGEWNWLYDQNLMHRGTFLGENVFTRFSSNPGLDLLPPMDSLGGMSPADHLSNSLLSELGNQVAEMADAVTPALLKRIKDTLSDLGSWLNGCNVRPSHLVDFHEVLGGLALALAKAYPRDDPDQSSEFHAVSRTLRLIKKIQLHPSFNGNPDSKGYDTLISRLPEYEAGAIQTAVNFPYPTFVGDITNPASPSRTTVEVVAGRVGLVEPAKRTTYKFESDPMNDSPILHALLNYTPEQAKVLFGKYVLKPYRYYDWRISVLLAPLFGQFFVELREQYGQEVPLEWILAVAGE